MANDYYNHGGYPSFKASGSSAPARSEFDAITAGFAKLPAKHASRPGFADPIEVGTPSLDTQAVQKGQVLLLTGGALSGPIVVPLGTAAVPGIQFASDLDTGIYSPGANQVGIATGGVGRLVVDATGAVALDAAPTGLGDPIGVTASHNSRQSVRIRNLDAGATATASFVVQTDAGQLILSNGSLASGGVAAVEATSDVGLIIGASDATGIIRFVAGGITQATLQANGTLDLVAGSGSLTFNGHKSRYESPVENMLTGAGVYTVRDPGASRRPDDVHVFVRNKTAQHNYTPGDVTHVSPGAISYFWDTESRLMRIIQGSTPIVLNATTGAAAACTPANWEVFFVALWL